MPCRLTFVPRTTLKLLRNVGKYLPIDSAQCFEMLSSSLLGYVDTETHMVREKLRTKSCTKPSPVHRAVCKFTCYVQIKWPFHGWCMHAASVTLCILYNQVFRAEWCPLLAVVVIRAQSLFEEWFAHAIFLAYGPIKPAVFCVSPFAIRLRLFTQQPTLVSLGCWFMLSK